MNKDVLEFEGDAEDILEAAECAILIGECPPQEEEVVVGGNFVLKVLTEHTTGYDFLHPTINHLVG